MIYSVNLKKLTKKINPFSFAKYLKDTGWTISDQTDLYKSFSKHQTEW